MKKADGPDRRFVSKTFLRLRGGVDQARRKKQQRITWKLHGRRLNGMLGARTYIGAVEPAGVKADERGVGEGETVNGYTATTRTDVQ